MEFSTSGAADVDLAAVRRVAGVRDVRAENGSIRMQATELHRAVPALLEELRPAGHSADRAAHALGDAGGRLRLADGTAPAR